MEAARLQELISREPKQTLFEGCGSLHILSKNGDDRIVWDRRFKDQIEQAKQKFYEMLDKGYIAYVVGPDGKEGRRITRFNPDAEEILIKSFDPNAHKIIMRPMIAGG